MQTSLFIELIFNALVIDDIMRSFPQFFTRHIHHSDWSFYSIHGDFMSAFLNNVSIEYSILIEIFFQLMNFYTFRIDGSLYGVHSYYAAQSTSRKKSG